MLTRSDDEQDVDAATGQPVQEDRWVPPKSWTAWPLPASVVPRPDFMKRTDVADERHAFRMQVPYVPRAELQETVSATILRLAKERFRARQAAQGEENAAVLDVESSEDDDHDDDDGNSSGAETSSAPRRRARSKSRTRSVSRARSMKFESTSDGEMMDVDTAPDMPLLGTVVATDDELSYSLLRPSAQRILVKLDATLTILHTAQESQTHRPSESGASDDASSRPQSRSRSRPRGRGPAENHHSQSPAAKRAGPATSRASSRAEPPGPPEPPANVKKIGRPRKVYPRLDGETERAYLVRIARQQKKQIPRFPDDDADNGDGDDDDDDDDDDPEPPSDSTPVPRPAAEHTDASASARAKPKAPRSRRRRRRPPGGADAEPSRKQRFSRVRLRDWRDILGAAALAGFPLAALDRAAQRCADLFGEGLALHTLRGPAFPSQTESDRRVLFEPGMAAPRVLEDSDADADGGKPPQPPPRSRPRWTSSASSVGQHFCTVDHCPRAVEPFSRRPNLLRHLRLIHGYEGDEVPVEADDGEDGFLKPIRVRPGWRTDDAVEEKGKKRQGRKRTRDGESEGTGDARMRDAGSTTGRETTDFSD